MKTEKEKTLQHSIYSNITGNKAGALKLKTWARVKIAYIKLREMRRFVEVLGEVQMRLKSIVCQNI